MKLKHWQGYGCVNATKEKCDRSEYLHIKVTGEHEYGLERDDFYDLHRWLVKRFDKSAADYLEYSKTHKYEIEVVSWKEVHYRFYKIDEKRWWEC